MADGGNGMAAFFAMGGHGSYVWPAYALSLVILGGVVFSRMRRTASARRQAAKSSED